MNIQVKLGNHARGELSEGTFVPGSVRLSGGEWEDAWFVVRDGQLVNADPVTLTDTTEGEG